MSFDTGCDGKQKHETRRHALDHLLSLRRNKGSKNNELAVYQCRLCGYFHVGNRQGSTHRKRRSWYQEQKRRMHEEGTW